MAVKQLDLMPIRSEMKRSAPATPSTLGGDKGVTWSFTTLDEEGRVVKVNMVFGQEWWLSLLENDVRAGLALVAFHPTAVKKVA